MEYLLKKSELINGPWRRLNTDFIKTAVGANP